MPRFCEYSTYFVAPQYGNESRARGRMLQTTIGIGVSCTLEAPAAKARCARDGRSHAFLSLRVWLPLFASGFCADRAGRPCDVRGKVLQ